MAKPVRRGHTSGLVHLWSERLDNDDEKGEKTVDNRSRLSTQMMSRRKISEIAQPTFVSSPRKVALESVAEEPRDKRMQMLMNSVKQESKDDLCLNNAASKKCGRPVGRSKSVRIQRVQFGLVPQNATANVDNQAKTNSVGATSSSSGSLGQEPKVGRARESPFNKFRQMEEELQQINSTPSFGRAGSVPRLTRQTSMPVAAAPVPAPAPAPVPNAARPPRVMRSATSAKETILTWVQQQINHYDNVSVTNFSTSWNDGLAFCALIHRFYPEAFDFGRLEAKNRRYNFTLAFKTAESYGDICPLLDVDDMVKFMKPDWKCVFTYVQSFYRRFRNGREPLPQMGLQRQSSLGSSSSFVLASSTTVEPYSSFRNVSVPPLPKTNFGPNADAKNLAISLAKAASNKASLDKTDYNVNTEFKSENKRADLSQNNVNSVFKSDNSLNNNLVLKQDNNIKSVLKTNNSRSDLFEKQGSNLNDQFDSDYNLNNNDTRSNEFKSNSDLNNSFERDSGNSDLVENHLSNYFVLKQNNNPTDVFKSDNDLNSTVFKSGNTDLKSDSNVTNLFNNDSTVFKKSPLNDLLSKGYFLKKHLSEPLVPPMTQSVSSPSMMTSFTEVSKASNEFVVCPNCGFHVGLDPTLVKA